MLFEEEIGTGFLNLFASVKNSFVVSIISHTQQSEVLIACLLKLMADERIEIVDLYRSNCGF